MQARVKWVEGLTFLGESASATAQGKRYNKNIGPRSSTGRETHDATAGRRFWRRVSPGGRE